MSRLNSIRVGIVGTECNAAYHIRYSRAYAGAQLVGIVEEKNYNASNWVSRFGIIKRFTSLNDLMEQEKPDVIHIVSAPATHLRFAKETIESGCHVIVESPLVLNRENAASLFELADQRAIKLCSMHEYLFEPCVMRARDVIESGRLGDLTQLEYCRTIDPRTPALREYPAPNVLPWLYELPGGIYQYFLTPPLYLMLGLTGRPRGLKVVQGSHGLLPQGIPDQFRVIIDGERVAGSVTLSFAGSRPRQLLTIHGTRGAIAVNIEGGTVVVHLASALGPVKRAIYAADKGSQRCQSAAIGFWNYVRGDREPHHGIQALIHTFYDSIKHDVGVPVSTADTLAVVEAIDEIRVQTKTPLLDFAPVLWKQYPYRATRQTKVLITGATGFLGKRLAKRLVDEGYPIRALARKLSDVGTLKGMGAEIVFGDLGDESSVIGAMQGVDVVVHAAAGTSGTEKDSRMGTIQGTRNVLDACRTTGIKKLVYISSCSVYEVAGYTENQVVTEDAQLERYPLRRGHYSAGKQQAELLVSQAMSHEGCPIVVLRPGTLYGPGADVYTRMIGISFAKRIFIVFGDGQHVLPLVHVDNVVDAIVESISNSMADNQVFNVVDTDRVTKELYIDRVVKTLYPKALVIYCPISLLLVLTWLQEKLIAMVGKQPFLTVYRLVSSQKRVRYSTSKIEEAIGWRSHVRFEQGVVQLIREHGRAANTV